VTDVVRLWPGTAPGSRDKVLPEVDSVATFFGQPETHLPSEVPPVKGLQLASQAFY
jgi:hypothetical protein